MSSAETKHDLAEVSPQQAAQSDRRRWAGLVILCVALFLEAMNLSSISVQIPSLSADLHLSTSTAQLLVSTYLVAYAGFLLLGGRIADWLGRRFVFLSGVVLFGLASLAAGLAGNAVLLIVARAVQGLGAALTTPAAMSIITITFPEGPERNRAMGVYSMLGASGFAIGAVLAGVLTSWLNWRWAFFDYVIIAAVVFLLTPLLVKKDSRSNAATRSIDFVGAIFVTASLLILVYTVGEAQAVAGLQTLAGLVLAIILLAVFVVIEMRVRAPLLPLGIFRLPTLVIANILGFTEFVGLTCVVFISTLYLQNVLNYTPFQAGLTLLPMGIVAIIAANLAPLLLNHLGIKPTLVAGMAVFTVGCALASVLVSVNGNFWDIVIPTLLIAGGSSVAFPATIIAAVAGVPDADQGLATGLITTAGQLGGAIGLAVVIFVAAIFTPVVAGAHAQVQAVNQALVSGFRPALVVTAAFVLLGTLLALASFRKSAPGQATPEVSSTMPVENEPVHTKRS